MTTALYAGSFDPIHVGHLSIVERAAAGYEAVVVAVLGNPSKRAGLFTVDERVRLVEASTAHLPNVRCVTHAGLTVDIARAVGATVLLRSAHKDRADELTMAATNERLSGILTSFVAADPSTAWISSSLVRSLAGDGRLEQARALVPPAVFAAIAAS